MLYFKMIAPVCTLVCAIIYVAFQEKWWKLHDGRRVRHKRAVGALVFFLILSTMATCVILYKDDADSLDLRSKIENCQPPQRIGALKPKYKETGSGSTSKAVRVAIEGQMVNIAAPEGTVLQPFGRNIAFSLRRTAEGLLVSAIVHNLDGRVIARVIENDWVVYDGRYLRRNFDEHAIEMLDDYDVPVLQVEYVTPTSVRIGGVFRAESKIIADIDKQFPAMRGGGGGAFFCTTSGGGRLILGDQATSIGGRWPTTDAGRQALATEAKSLITPWFDYTIPDRLGVRYLKKKESVR
jgi:hypothetical protein